MSRSLLRPGVVSHVFEFRTEILLVAISVPTDLFGCVVYREGLKAKPEKLAPPELWLVELALALAGWKPALLDGGTDAFL